MYGKMLLQNQVIEKLFTMPACHLLCLHVILCVIMISPATLYLLDAETALNTCMNLIINVYVDINW